jgi:hypothetical protein
VALAATPASALTPIPDASFLPNGNYTAKYNNFSDLYWASGTTADETGQGVAAGPNGLPSFYQSGATAFGQYLAAVAAYSANGANSPGTLENRTIFNTTTILNASSQTVWNGSSQQLSGMLYDLTLVGVAESGSTLTLDFGADTRSAPLSGPGLASLPAGSGGVLQVYASSSTVSTSFGSPNQAPDPNNVGNFSPNGHSITPAAVDATAIVNNGTGTWGPASWVAGTGATSDSYPGIVNGGSLWLSAEFVPFSLLGLTPGTAAPASSVLFEENINLTAGVVGSAEGYADLVGGSDYGNLGASISAPNGYLVDLAIGSDEYPVIDNASGFLQTFGAYTGAGYWPVDSQDPVTFEVNVIPEPATMTLLGFGLAGLLIRRRKK